MSIKYKIDDDKKNKNLINDEIKLSRINSKGGPGSDRTPPKKQKSTRDLLRLKMINFENVSNVKLSVFII